MRFICLEKYISLQRNKYTGWRIQNETEAFSGSSVLFLKNAQTRRVTKARRTHAIFYSTIVKLQK